jgi:glycosyltransferase involved in cell wall biosynthesis
MKPIRLAIIGTRGYPSTYGGYETFIKELSEILVAKNISVRVYCHKSLFKHQPRTRNGIELVYIPSIESKSLSQPVHSFLSMIHACFSKCNVIFVVNAGNGIWGFIPKLFGKKTAINVDGMEWERPKWKGFGAKFFYFSAWLATKWYDRIITDAAEMQKRYKQIFNVDSEMIAYGGKISYSVNPGLINQWILQPQEYYLIIGRLIPDNNADLLIRGFLRSGSSKKLVIVGDVSYKDAYADSIKSIVNPSVIFTGHINNNEQLAELYHNCFAYLHGHQFGGTNPTMITALANGCAILALDTPFSAEMLSNGNFGVLFANEASLAEKINFLENQQTFTAQLRSNARKAINEKYNWEAIADQYIMVFTDLAARSKLL